MFLSRRQRRCHREPDHGAAGAEHQRHTGHTLAHQREPAGTEPHHGRVRAVGRPRDRRQRCARQGVARTTLPAAQLRPAHRVESRRRRTPHPHGGHTKRQALAARTERNSRPHREGAAADHPGGEQRIHLGREALLHAPLARPGENVGLRRDADGREERARPRKRGTAVGFHRGQHHGALHPHHGTDAHDRGIQQPRHQRKRGTHRPLQRHRNRRAGTARPEKLHEDERRADGKRGGGAAARRQPHQHRRRRAPAHGADEEGPARRREV